MGIVSSPLPCRTYSTESESNSSSTSHLQSEPSLPSIPTLSQVLLQYPINTHHSCIATLQSSSSVCSLVLSGKHLYSGSSGGEIRLVDISSKDTNYKTVATSASSVKSIVIVDDKLFSSHQDHKIRVWKIDPTEHPQQILKCIATLPTLKDRLPRVFLPNSYVKVRRHKYSTWVHHVDAISALAVSNDKSLLYSASWDCTFKIWRCSDFKCLESVSNAHEDAINAIAVSNDGFVYTGSADKKIKVWKKNVTRAEKQQKHEPVGSLENHKSAVNALAFSGDGCVLYSGACDRSILVWERDQGGGGGMVVVGALRGHSKAILCLAVVGDLVCSGSADCSVRIWRRGVDDGRRSYTCLAVLEGHRRPVKCLTAAVDYNTEDRGDFVNSFVVCSGSLDCDIKEWQVQVPIAN